METGCLFLQCVIYLLSTKGFVSVFLQEKVYYDTVLVC